MLYSSGWAHLGQHPWTPTPSQSSSATWAPLTLCPDPFFTLQFLPNLKSPSGEF